MSLFEKPTFTNDMLLNEHENASLKVYMNDEATQRTSKKKKRQKKKKEFVQDLQDDEEEGDWFNPRESLQESNCSDNESNLNAQVYNFSSEPHCVSPPSSSPVKSPSKTFNVSFGIRNKRDSSYDVTFEHGPIGLQMETDWYGRQAVVKSFKKVGGDIGLAEKCGLIRIGDVLTAINDESCLELSFKQKLSKLREVSTSRHTLHFMTLEAAGDLSMYNQDSDILLAKKYIHEHKQKYYRPMEIEDDMIYGCVERLRGAYVTSFNFYREDTGETSTSIKVMYLTYSFNEIDCLSGCIRFLLACSCDFEMTGNFIFHTVKDSHLREMKDLIPNEDNAIYLGMMSPNFVGTDFTLHDHRVTDPSVKHRSIHDLGLVVYDTNVLGRVPNFLKAVIPRIPEDLKKKSLLPTQSNINERYKLLKQTRKVSLMDRIRSFSLDELDFKLKEYFKDDGPQIQSSMTKRNSVSFSPRDSSPTVSRQISNPNLAYGAIEQEDNTELLVFQTKQPTWNDDLCAWTLNFNGRVKQASKKNFLLVAEEGNDRMEDEFGDLVFLRFGKISKQRFTLDFRSPISPVVALGIAASAFAKKIAVT